MQENISWCTGIKRPWAFSSSLLCILWNWAWQHLLGVTNFQEDNYFPVLFMAWLQIGVGQESSVIGRKLFWFLRCWNSGVTVIILIRYTSLSVRVLVSYQNILNIYWIYYFRGVHAGVRVCMLCLPECRSSGFSTRITAWPVWVCLSEGRVRRAAQVCCVLVFLRRGRQTFPGFLPSFAKKGNVTIFPNLQM